MNPKGFGYEGVSKLVLCHYPFHEWNRSRHNHKPGNELSLNLHGHTHSNGERNEQCHEQGVYRYDVGVDANDYQPVTLDDIMGQWGASEITLTRDAFPQAICQDTD